MEIIEEDIDYVVYDVHGLALLSSLPDASVDAVLADVSDIFSRENIIQTATHEIARILKPSAYAFIIGDSWGGAFSLQGMTVYSSNKVTVAGMTGSSRLFFHAIACTETECDQCSVQILNTLTSNGAANKLVPFVATSGTIAIPWGRNHEMIDACRSHRRNSLASRET